ncbi:MAG: PEP-CTERM sorting domain-containing protein [Myxococcota bacterium]
MRKQQWCKQGAAVLALGFLSVALAAPAGALSSFGFSQASSDSTPAEWLGATLSYEVVDLQTFTLSVRNDTAGATAFDISHVFFNVGDQVGYLNLVEAVSSVNGTNTGAWSVGDYGYDRTTAFFGNFDQSLRTAPGASATERIAPGETQSFTLQMNCDYSACDFDALLGDLSAGGYGQAHAALRFTYGPNLDAAFGAITNLGTTVVPEPSTGLLMATGLAAWGLRRRTRA